MDQNKHPAPPARVSVWLALGLATVPVLLVAFETVTFSRLANRPISWPNAFAAAAPQWYTWALLMPAIVAVGARFPINRPLRAQNLAMHVLASLVASATVAFASALVAPWVRPVSQPLITSARMWFIGQLPATTVVYFAIVGVSYAVAGAVALRERERRAAELEAQLRDAQLSALRMQLQPHFLFNSLNAIMALVRDQDTPRAVRALSLLGDILRATVNAGDAQETTLAREMEFVTRYLEIERLRFGERLRITVDIPETLSTAMVPTFVLQPFVENSLKHGVLRERAGNELAIRARATQTSLLLRVTDDGRGFAANGPTSGVGIANARARLDRMYGSSARLSLGNPTTGTGTVVEIELPLRAGS